MFLPRFAPTAVIVWLICQSGNSHVDAQKDMAKPASNVKKGQNTKSTIKARQSSSKLPNIVILLADDLGIGDVGCFGNDTIRTPFIDSIARQGVRLSHHLTAAPMCTPSRAALLTGRYPVRMGMAPHDFRRVFFYVSSTSGLPPKEITLAEMVKDKGYATAAIGKWHIGMHCDTSADFCHFPLKQGFDYFYGLPLSNVKDFGDDGLTLMKSRFLYVDEFVVAVVVGGVILFHTLHKLGIIGRKLSYFLMVLLLVLNLNFVWMYKNLKIFSSIAMRNYEVVEQPVNWPGFAQRLVQEAQTFLGERAQDMKPFLLYLPWTQVHTVLHASKKFRGQSRHGNYGDDVEELDWSVGQTLQTLERLGMKDNTFVYFSSDNGGHIEEKGPNGSREGGHNGIYRGGKGQGGMEGGIRVPSVAMWPGRIPAGSEIALPTSQMDLFPTVAGILGMSLPSDRLIDGKDMMPLLTGDSRTPTHEFMMHYCGTDINAARYTPADGENVWKVHFITPNWIPGTESCGYICPCSGWGTTLHDPPLLYNIAKDPSERTPLDVNDPKHREIVNKIIEAREKHLKTVEEVPTQFHIMKMLPRFQIQPCCGDSFFPYCNCTDSRYAGLVSAEKSSN